ncbi:uncharacterized protein LOC144607232 isoform X2 [Rhinoraja longicauda]
MRRAGLYQRRGKLEPIPSPKRLDISLLVKRCLSIGSGSALRLAPSRSSWGASMLPSTTLPTTTLPTTTLPTTTLPTTTLPTTTLPTTTLPTTTLPTTTLPTIRSLPDPKTTQVSDAGERGNSETLPVPPQHLPTRVVRRITVDLRPALASVYEPCEPTEEVMPEEAMPEEAMPEEVGSATSLYPGDASTVYRPKNRHPAHAGISNTNPLAGSPRRNGPLQLLKVHMPLPPIVHPPGSERSPGLGGAITAQESSPKLQLVQVTEGGVLAKPGLVFHPITCPGSRSIPFPKILLVTHSDKTSAHGESTFRQESDPANLQLKEMKQSFERSVEGSTITFHQLMHQMTQRTSSANHVLIAEVLKALREELWSTSQQSQHVGQNERDPMGCVRNRRSISLCRRSENRMDGQAGYICPPSTHLQRRDKLPVRLNLAKHR